MCNFFKHHPIDLNEIKGEREREISMMVGVDNKIRSQEKYVTYSTYADRL